MFVRPLSLGMMLLLVACSTRPVPNDTATEANVVEDTEAVVDDGVDAGEETGPDADPLPDVVVVEEPGEDALSEPALMEASVDVIAVMDVQPDVQPDVQVDVQPDARPDVQTMMDAAVDVRLDVVAEPMMEVGVDAVVRDIQRTDLGTLSEEVKIAAANLTSGSRQSYDGEAGLRILQGLRPDIVLIQELNYRTNTDADFRDIAQRVVGPMGIYHRGPASQIPNGVLSRFPFVNTGHWVDPYVDNRGFTWARIDVPGPRDVFAVSLHLLSSSTTNRGLEATALVNLLRMELRPTDFLVLGGDFNTQVRVEPCTMNLAAVVEVNGPYPVDQMANENTNSPRNRPYDWVVVSPDLLPYEVPVRLGTSVYPTGLVFDTRVYTPLTDAPGVLAADSAASGMQHMAVVRSFRFPL